jgi:hypothetical protein
MWVATFSVTVSPGGLIRGRKAAYPHRLSTQKEQRRPHRQRSPSKAVP